MAGTSITKHNFVTNDAFLTSLVSDLTAAGFTKVYPVDTYNPNTSPLVVLQATPTIDSLAEAQPWRIALRKRGATGDAAQCVDLILGTPNTISDTGVLATVYQSVSTQTDTQPVGIIGSAYAADTISKTSLTHRSKVFWSRADRDSVTGTDVANPFSYKLTTTGRGIALHVWEPGNVLGKDNQGPISSTVVIQRLVDNATGATLVTGKAPLHCLYCIYNQFYRMVVREQDILSPGPSIYADDRTVINLLAPASGAGADITATGIDTLNQSGFGTQNSSVKITTTPAGGLFPPIIDNRSYLAITEDNNYVTTFPSGFTTSRYAYYGEMDLIAYTSADIVAQNAIIQFTAYGESTPRKYQALTATGPDSTKVRILQLIDGGDTALVS